MSLKLFLVPVLALMLVGCQFNETIVFNPDGSGTMNMEVNLDQMIEMIGSMDDDQEASKMDTLIVIKDFLREKKDSIASLPKKEQDALKKMEAYKIRLNMDSDKNVMRYHLIADFKDVSEMNDITDAIGKIGDLAPASEANSLQNKNENGDDAEDVIGVNFSFKNNKFIRDGYIKDKKRHKQQIDSMKSMEGFFGASVYSLHYKFPKKIKRVSNSGAEVSSDKKSLKLQSLFLDYFKNPDILDVEVEFEK